MTTTKTKRLVESALMVALAAVLSLIKIWKMPLEGSVTLLSMLPICLLSIRYGVKWGLFVSAFYSVVQIALDLASLMSWGMTVRIWIGALIFDYLLAYTPLGLAGLFRKKGSIGIVCGISLVMVMRFISHFISGTIFFDVWCPEGWNPAWYSVCYNGFYMLPELIFTVAGTLILSKMYPKLFSTNNA